MGGGGMMNMMGKMPMMDMMQTMGMMRPSGDGAGMATIDRIEGRIAFLRAELAITQTQVPQWDAFAKALRDSTARLKEAQSAAAQAAATTFLQRTEFQEQWLGARLEGVKEIKTAFAGLQAVLSEDQKKTAEALLTQPVCLGQMGMM